jgi:hypothetical protein
MFGVAFLSTDIDLSTFLLFGVLLIVGDTLVHRRPKLRDTGKHIAAGAFFVFAAILVFVQQPMDSMAWLAVFFRSLLFAGIVQGASWTLLPAVLCVYENTIGLAYKAWTVRSEKIRRRAKEAQAERDRELRAIHDREHQEQDMVRRAERERAQEIKRQQELRDERIRLQHEQEQEFYRLREEAVGLFLKHHVLLIDEVSVAAIKEDYDKQHPSIHKSWSTFLQFNLGWQYRILITAARNNIINDYTRVEPVIGSVCPRDQFELLVNEALERDRGAHDVDACMQRLQGLHDQFVALFETRIPEWQINADALRAETYADAFAEIDDGPKEQNPFDDNDRPPCHENVG